MTSDGWYAAYSIIISPGTTMDELRGLEHALGVEGSETAPADGNAALWKTYTANLNLVQATLPDSTAFVNMTYSFVWDGKPVDGDDPYAVTGVEVSDPDSSETRRLSNTTAGGDEGDGHRFNQQTSFNPTLFPPPAGGAQVINGLTGNNHLKVISQQKGQALGSPGYYTYISPAGEGIWVFVSTTLPFTVPRPSCSGIPEHITSG